MKKKVALPEDKVIVIVSTNVTRMSRISTRTKSAAYTFGGVDAEKPVLRALLKDVLQVALDNFTEETVATEIRKVWSRTVLNHKFK